MSFTTPSLELAAVPEDHIITMADDVRLGEASILLTASGLSTDDLGSRGSIYWLAIAKDTIGVCGLEIDEEFGLLRSLAVRSDYRGRGVANMLVTHAAEHARDQGLVALYTFSKDSGGFFERRGWRETSVAEAAARLRNAPQVMRYQRNGWYPDERAFRRPLTD